MNRQVFTLMTVFLMLGALWSGAWGANGDNDICTEATNETKFNNPYQSYLIGDGTHFLTAGKDVNGFTILSSTVLDLSTDQQPANDKILEALWTIETFKPTPDSPDVLYKIKSKKTNHYLSFKDADGLPTENDKLEVSAFTWFDSEKYETNGKPLIISKSANRGITISSTTVTVTSPDDISSLTNLKVYTLKDTKLMVSAESLNQQMDNGFILAAKKGSTDIKVEDNGLLNKKLVAFSFHVSTAFENEDVKKILGTGTITASDKPDLQRIYLAVSGYEDLMKYVKEGTYTIDIKEKQFDTEDNTKILWEAKDVIAAFKKATFVAVDKIQNYHPIESKPGLGYQYATFLGKDLLTTDTKKVPIQNAQFCIKNSSSIGSTSTSDYLIITNPFALFPNDNGDMTGSAVEVRPYVKEGEDTENKKYYLTSAPANGSYTWTQIGFTSGGGIVNYDHFKKNKYSVTIADKKIEDTENRVYYHDLSELSVYGWLISPSTGRYKGEDQKDHFNPKFEEPTEILADKPEGQWIFQYNNTDGFRMYNRESSEYITLGKRIYKVNGEDNLYHIPGGIQGSIAGFPQKFIIDTLRLTTTDKGGLYGYAHSEKSGDAFDPVVLKNTAYRLGIQNGTFDKSIVFVQKSLTHNNTLVVDVKSEEGLYFYLVPCETVSYGITQPREEEQEDKAGYYDPTNKKDPIDNLKRIKYALQERTSKRYVIYDNANRRFMLSDDYDDVDKALDEAAKFFFKEKGNDQYILLYCEGKYDEDKKIWYDETKDKMYANIGDACLHKIDMYTKDIADKFGFHSSESPMFVDIMKRLKGDNDTTLCKINLYSVQNRSGNQKYMLAAGQNNFLVEGIPDTRSDIIINSKAIGGLAYDSIKFSITVDTAYVRRTYMTDEDGKKYLSSVMPLYYLGMSSLDPKENVDRDTIGPLHPWDKDEFGHLIECQHYLRYTSGNFLFAMNDSIYHGMDKFVQREDHCYHYWNTHNPRLRFVHASHMRDTMIVTSVRPASKDTMRAGYVTTTIEASKEKEWLAPQVDETGRLGSPNYGLFAFEVNPNPFDPEVPEYALWNPASKKYIAYVNGNLIMEDQPSYYTLDIKSEGHSIVSNEMVRTSDVRVVAAQGKVIIQNAAGKKVFLQTALGKTLADTVLTSDQEEMAAPAGIVFVTVEGEETVKTIVK